MRIKVNSETPRTAFLSSLFFFLLRWSGHHLRRLLLLNGPLCVCGSGPDDWTRLTPSCLFSPTPPQPFKASTRSTRSRASRRPGAWTASTRGCLPAATATSTSRRPPSTTCPPAPDPRTRTAPTRRPKKKNPSSSLPSFLPSLPRPPSVSFPPFPPSLLVSFKSRRREEAVQSERLSPRLIYFII